MNRDQSIKADAGKLRLELIPPEVIEALGRVLTYGAEKYSANSWQQVEPERYVGALLRHMTAYMRDPDGVDGESGIPHIEHALCNAAFLTWMRKRHQENAFDSERVDPASSVCFCKDCEHYYEYDEWDRDRAETFKQHTCELLNRNLGAYGYCVLARERQEHHDETRSN